MNNFAEIVKNMSNQPELFESNEFSFEDYKQENGISFWWASDLCKMLGYKDQSSFDKAIGRAIKACITLNIPQEDNFIHSIREINGVTLKDCKLTRFACYLTVMNADTKKLAVAQAQVYFAEQTRKFELYIQNSEQFDRILIRDEIKDGQKSLTKVASNAGVVDYARFHNAGFLGLYNKLNVELAKSRKIEPSKLYDYMGRTELAANLFRITQTEERIKNFEVKGQNNLEKTHYAVGKEVREIIIKNTGKRPEQLPMEKKLPEIQKELKKGYRNMIKDDKKKK